MSKILRFNDSENFFKCPVCKDTLFFKEKSLVCYGNHCFDISKYGYVNLFLNGKQLKHYDKDSFENREKILEKGYYSHILHELIDLIGQTDAKVLLDAGCGEGYYSREIHKTLGKEILAFDISKDSIQLAAKKDESRLIKWFVGDLAHLPIQDHTIDCILDIFSPANYEEFRRILSDSGYVIKVIPGNNHLRELRTIAGEQLQNKDYSNSKITELFRSNFEIISEKKVSKTFEMPLDDLIVFANMTPLLFHVDKSKIDWSAIPSLTVEAEILVGRI